MNQALGQGDWPTLRDLLETLDPGLLETSWSCMTTAQAAEALGDYERAVRCYHRALALEPTDAEAVRRLARIRTDQGQRDRAIRAWRKLLELRPADPEATEALATTLVEAGRPEQAALLRPSAPEEREATTHGAVDDAALLTFVSRFSGREGVHARQWTKPTTGQHGYEPVRAPLTAAVAREHLLGVVTVGVYPLRMDSTVRFLAFDLDIAPGLRPQLHHGRRVEELNQIVQGAAVRVVEALEALGIDALIEDSGGKGRHVWVFFDEPISAMAARRLADRVARRVGDLPPEVTAEIFPKQGRLPPEKLGNLIKLPLGYHKVTGRRCDLLTRDGRIIDDPLEALRVVPRVTREQLLSLVGDAPLEPPARSDTEADTLDEAPDESAEVPFDEPAGAAPTRVTEVGASVESAYRLEDDAEVQWLLSRCEVLGALVARASESAVLTSEQRQVVTYTLGHLKNGAQATNAVLSRVLNVEPQGFLKSPLRGHPMSCPRIRGRVPDIAQSVRCDCRFAEGAGSYPTPLLHLREQPATARSGLPAPGDVSRLQLERLVGELMRARGEARRWARLTSELETRLREIMAEQALDVLDTPLGPLRLGADADGAPRLALSLDPLEKMPLKTDPNPVE